MFIKRETVTVTTVSAGTATAYSSIVNGRILAIQYVKDGYANGVDFTITTETTAQSLWRKDSVDASAIQRPRVTVQNSTASDVYYNDESDEEIMDYIHVADERIKIVLANGGDVKSGTFYITVG